MPRLLAVAAILPLVAAAFALTACTSPIASREESSKDQPTTEVGQGVHGWPLYERDILKNGVRTDVLWPVSSIRQVEDGSVRRADILFPIGHYEHQDQRTRYGLRPLFDVETDMTVTGPVTDWDVLWPLVGWRSSPDETRSHVFPLWFSRRSESSDWETLFPLYWNGRTGDSDWFHLWPFYGEHNSGTDARQWVLLPFFGHHIDTVDEREEWDAFAPLLHWGRWKDGESTRIAPFWWHERDGADEWSLLFPLYFESRTPVAETQVFGPLYARHHTAKIDSRIYGGFLYMTSDLVDGSRSSQDVLWPIYYREDRRTTATQAEGQTTRLFPIVWSNSDGDAGYLHVWPFYGRDWSPKRTTSSTIWPFFTYTDHASGAWELNAPLPLVHFRRGDDRSETRIFPLFDHETRKDGSYETNVGLLFNTEANAKGHHATSLIPLFSSSGDADGSYEGSAGLILANWDGDGKGASTFHVLWRLVQNDDIAVEEGDATHTRHLFALNPLYRYESNDRGDTSWQALFGLVARTQKAGDVRWRFLWFIGG